MTKQIKPTITLEELLINSGLNEDVFVEILIRLNTRELLQICDFDSDGDKSFLNLVSKRVISRALIDFDTIEKFYVKNNWNASRVFRLFGKSITRMKITVSFVTFYYLMIWIKRFCNPDKLKYLNLIIEVGFYICYDFQLLEELRPFLKNMKIKTECENIYQKTEMRHVLNYFQSDIHEIETLAIDGYQLFKYCSNKMTSSSRLFENITELRISNVNLEMYIHRLFIYLRKMPNIEKFVYIQYNPQIIAMVGKEVVECIPNLKSFGFVTHRFHCSPGFNSDFNILECFNFLNNFRNLIEIEIGADFNCRGVAELLQYTLNVRTVSIYQIDFLCQMEDEIQSIFREIRRIIARRSSYKRIDMIVNERQLMFFQRLKNTDKFMNFYVKRRITSSIHYDV